MIHLFWSRFRFLRQRWIIYPMLSFLVAIGIFWGTPAFTQSIPRGANLLLQGIQILQLSSVSERDEVALGEQINQELVRSGQVRLYNDPSLNQYVKRIGQRLATKGLRPNLSYTFQIVDDNKINAFATMGGFVYVNTGTIRAADNEAELAGVMAHEIGHIEGRHALKQMRQMALARGIAAAAGVDSSRLVGIGVDLALRRPRSRQMEFEADQLGLSSLTKAGYAAIGLVNFMKKLQTTGGRVPTILSTHPAADDRVVALERSLNPATARTGDGLDSQSYKSTVGPLARS
jgi:beta-barrel assembly-enhancing protease